MKRFRQSALQIENALLPDINSFTNPLFFKHEHLPAQTAERCPVFKKYIEAITKVIQKRSKMQLQRGVKGNLRLLPAAVTAENAPFADQSRCAFRFLRTFVITSLN